LFKYFDQKKKGEISLEDFLKVYYDNLTSADIEVINEWYYEFKNLHEADNFDMSEFSKKKEKKTGMELPKSTLKRMDEIFNSIDRDKKGYLTLEDLKLSYNTGFSIKELEDMIKEFGRSNKIYMPEFIKMTLPEEWTIEGTDYVGS
jgi:Ca2+-binding EF-hand superfamily protein